MASASAVECTATVAMPSSLRRAQDAQRDLAAIGYQDLVEHVVLAKRASSEWLSES